MPRLDRTGPAGAGPMTGRGRGPCGGSYGRGGGFGGMLCPFWRQSSSKDKTEYLQSEAEALKEELKAVKSELEKLKK
jgi:hypothetical protein